MGSITDVINTSLAEPFWVASDFLDAMGSSDLAEKAWEIGLDLSDSL